MSLSSLSDVCEVMWRCCFFRPPATCCCLSGRVSATTGMLGMDKYVTVQWVRWVTEVCVINTVVINATKHYYVVCVLGTDVLDWHLWVFKMDHSEYPSSDQTLALVLVDQHQTLVVWMLSFLVVLIVNVVPLTVSRRLSGLWCLSVRSKHHPPGSNFRCRGKNVFWGQSLLDHERKPAKSDQVHHHTTTITLHTSVNTL